VPILTKKLILSYYLSEFNYSVSHQDEA